MANEKPEERATVLIDQQLTQAGWYVCDRKNLDLINHKPAVIACGLSVRGNGEGR